MWVRLESEEERYERVGRLPGEVKVRMAIAMTDLAVSVCAEGIRAQFPGITEKEIIKKLRERFEWMKRYRKREV